MPRRPKKPTAIEGTVAQIIELEEARNTRRAKPGRPPVNEERITRTYRMTPAEQHNLDHMVGLLRGHGVPVSRSDLTRIGVSLLTDMVQQAMERQALPNDMPVESLEAWARSRVRNLTFPETLNGTQQPVPSRANLTTQTSSPEPRRRTAI